MTTEPSGAPDDVRRLAEQRQQARADRDFAAADGLRDEIAAAGWLVQDGPDGFTLTPRPAYDVLPTVTDLPDRSSAPDDRPVTVSVLVDGWPDDARTCLDALLAHSTAPLQVCEIGDVDGAGAVMEDYAEHERVDVIHVERPAGWAQARTALLRADTATVHVWCEVSTVLTGDAISPLVAAITDDPDVVAAGWRGVDVDERAEWREFTDAGPGQVDAILGYLFAMRRSAALAAGGPHPKARYYRNADMEFSFALKDAARQAGGRGTVVVPSADLPATQGRHHGYHDVDPAYRDKESRKTYQRFLQRFRGRTDLLAPRA